MHLFGKFRTFSKGNNLFNSKIQAIGALYFLISLGNFSTLFVCLIIFDAIMISRNALVSEKVGFYYNKFYNLAADMAIKYIPRYIEKSEKKQISILLYRIIFLNEEDLNILS